MPLVRSHSYFSDQDLIRLLGGFNLYQLASNTHWTFYKLRETQASIDEIVLEIFINQESSKGMIDISDSRGYSFFKDKEINISPKNIRYSEEWMYD